MDLQRPATSIAGAYLRGAHQADKLLGRAPEQDEIGPATAEFLGMLALFDGVRKTGYRLLLGLVCRLDPRVLPPGVSPKGLDTVQLADAVLGLPPGDVVDMTRHDLL